MVPTVSRRWRTISSKRTGLISTTGCTDRVRHGTWPNAFGYRFTTPDRVIVISGDAAPDDAVEQHAKGADILIHEVYSVEGFRKRDPFWQKYHSTNHTSAHELGELASRAKPKLLVLYHVLFWGSSEEQVLREVREKYAGEAVLADDLDVFLDGPPSLDRRHRHPDNLPPAGRKAAPENGDVAGRRSRRVRATDS